jgi:predicted deacylase
MSTRRTLTFEEYYNEIQKTESPVVIVGGIHGDEPAGNLAAKRFEGKEGIVVISDVNTTGERRLDGVDPNRHFDKKDSLPIEDKILSKIEEIKPRLVISLHEDDTTDEVYAYCSPGMVDKVKAALKSLKVPLAKSAIGDKTDEGVISHGHLPTVGTLERALRKHDIPSVTFETPVKSYSLKDRVELQIKAVNFLLKVNS